MNRIASSAKTSQACLGDSRAGPTVAPSRSLKRALSGLVIPPISIERACWNDRASDGAPLCHLPLAKVE